MILYNTPNGPKTDAEQLATEARARITELADTTFWAYSQLQNYLTNNTKGVTADQVKKAVGDAKGFDKAMRHMKAFLIHVNPDFKEKLAALTPPKPKKTAQKAR